MLPPDALSPVTVYEAPEPSRRGGVGLLGRMLGIVAAGILMLDGFTNTSNADISCATLSRDTPRSHANCSVNRIAWGGIPHA